jgi:hypothetical protein
LIIVDNSVKELVAVATRQRTMEEAMEMFTNKDGIAIRISNTKVGELVSELLNIIGDAGVSTTDTAVGELLDNLIEADQTKGND